MTMTTRQLLLLAVQATCLAACSSELSDPAQGGGSPSEPAAPPASPTTGVPGSSSSAPVFGDPESPSEDPTGYFEGEACAGLSASAERSPALLQLLVDTSGSMNEDAPGMRGSRWSVTLESLLGGIASMADEVALGVIFYPNVPQNAEPCFDRQTAVPIDLLGSSGSPQRQAITRAFETKEPDGGTPTHDAYQFALSEVLATEAARRFVVLITDGVPTFSLGCVSGGGFGPFQQPVDPAPLVGEAATALENDIRTFVVGSPGSEDARESLSRMAEAGGTAAASCSHEGPEFCHFDMTSETDLGAGLDEALGVISTALSCDYVIPPAPGGTVLDPSKVNLLFTPPGGAEELIVQNTGASCGEGWQYSEDQTHIRLCPSTCERIRDSRGQVTLRFGCATVLR